MTCILRRVVFYSLKRKFLRNSNFNVQLNYSVFINCLLGILPQNLKKKEFLHVLLNTGNEFSNLAIRTNSLSKCNQECVLQHTRAQAVRENFN